MGHRAGRGGSPDDPDDELGRRIRKEIQDTGDGLEIADGLPVILVKIQRRKRRRQQIGMTLVYVFLFVVLLLTGFVTGYAVHMPAAKSTPVTRAVGTPGHCIK